MGVNPVAGSVTPHSAADCQSYNEGTTPGDNTGTAHMNNTNASELDRHEMAGEPKEKAGEPKQKDDPPKVVAEFSSRDVLLGRGRQVHDHTGNQVYREHIKTESRAYIRANTLKEKDAICQKIVLRVHDKGGLFLRPHKGEEKGRWEECPKAIVWTKVKQALRDIEKESARFKKSKLAPLVMARGQAETVMARGPAEAVTARAPAEAVQPFPEDVPSGPQTIEYMIETEDSHEDPSPRKLPKKNATCNSPGAATDNKLRQQLLEAASLLARAATRAQPSCPVQLTTTTQSIFNMHVVPPPPWTQQPIPDQMLLQQRIPNHMLLHQPIPNQMLLQHNLALLQQHQLPPPPIHPAALMQRNPTLPPYQPPASVGRRHLRHSPSK